MNSLIAAAAINDLDELVRLHTRCFPLYMNTRLGKRYLRSNLYWYLSQPGAMLLTARGDGKIISYVAGIRAGSAGRMNRFLFFPALEGFLRHPWLLFHKKFILTAIKKLLSLFAAPSRHEPAIGGPGLHVLSICTDPLYRGQGIARQLLREMEARAAQKNFRYLRLFTYKNNETAQHLYTEEGWKAVSETGSGHYFVREIPHSR
jgi:ribosomal protein S18 acetylase RimI-like enzyme